MASNTVTGPKFAADLTAVIKWGQQAVPLKEFATKYPVPTLVKIANTNGQYNKSFSPGITKSLSDELYLHSIKPSYRVLAECVSGREWKQRVGVSTSQKYALPLTYQGWFEVLSEDGKSIPPIQRISDVAQLQVSGFVLRSTAKAYCGSEVEGTVTSDGGKIAFDKLPKVLQKGDHMRIVRGVVAEEPCSPQLPIRGGGAGMDAKPRRFLKCQDSKGETVYFDFEQTGLFSPVAGLTNISGVHRIRKLTEKFRMPILVRLVHGVVPSRMEKRFNGVFRLLTVYSDETAFVCSLKTDSAMVPISTREPLNLAVAKNFDELRLTEECQYHHIRCTQMVASYMNSIHVLYSNPDPRMLVAGKVLVVAGVDENLNGLGARATAATPGCDSGLGTTTDEEATSLRPPTMEEENLYEEIDDIYRYIVRDGGAIPRFTRKLPPTSNLGLSNGIQSNSQNRRLLPTSIERRNPSDKLSSPAGARLYKKGNAPPSKPLNERTNILASGDDPSQVNKRGVNQVEPIYETLEKIQGMKKTGSRTSEISAPAVQIPSSNTVPQSPPVDQSERKVSPSTIKPPSDRNASLLQKAVDSLKPEATQTNHQAPTVLQRGSNPNNVTQSQLSPPQPIKDELIESIRQALNKRKNQKLLSLSPPQTSSTNNAGQTSRSGEAVRDIFSPMTAVALNKSVDDVRLLSSKSAPNIAQSPSGERADVKEKSRRPTSGTEERRKMLVPSPNKDTSRTEHLPLKFGDQLKSNEINKASKKGNHGSPTNLATPPSNLQPTSSIPSYQSSNPITPVYQSTLELGDASTLPDNNENWARKFLNKSGRAKSIVSLYITSPPNVLLQDRHHTTSNSTSATTVASSNSSRRRASRHLQHYRDMETHSSYHLLSPSSTNHEKLTRSHSLKDSESSSTLEAQSKMRSGVADKPGVKGPYVVVARLENDAVLESRISEPVSQYRRRKPCSRSLTDNSISAASGTYNTHL